MLFHAGHTYSINFRSSQIKLQSPHTSETNQLSSNQSIWGSNHGRKFTTKQTLNPTHKIMNRRWCEWHASTAVTGFYLMFPQSQWERSSTPTLLHRYNWKMAVLTDLHQLNWMVKSTWAKKINNFYTIPLYWAIDVIISFCQLLFICNCTLNSADNK